MHTTPEPIDERVLRDIQALASAFPSSSPAGVWNELSAKHTALIREFGFRNFKRTINFEYSQWGASSFRDRKIRRLAANLLREGKFPVGGFLARCDAGDTGGIRWPDGTDPRTGASVVRARRGGVGALRAYAFYCGLLWQYALGEDRLGCMSRVEEPSFGNPMPVFYRGRLISQDIALSALTLNRIAAHLPLDGVRRVLEIGAGYGRLAWLFRSVFPGVEYTILDIPPALAVSRHYLEAVFGSGSVAAYFDRPFQGGDGRRVNCLPAGRAGEIPDGYFDLVVNISSFDEMTPDDVGNYFRLLERVATGWLYVQGYAESPVPGRRLSVNEFPYGNRWREVYAGRDPVVPKFVEKVLAKNPGA